MGAGGGAGITEKRHSRRVTTNLYDGGGGRGRNNGKTLLTRGHNCPLRWERRGGQGKNKQKRYSRRKQKRYSHRVTTDLLDGGGGGTGISKNVTHN